MSPEFAVHAMLCANIIRRAIVADHCQFTFIDRWIVLRLLDKPRSKANHPDDADKARNEKPKPPGGKMRQFFQKRNVIEQSVKSSRAEKAKNGGKNDRRKSAAPSRQQPQKPAGPAARFNRQPRLLHLGHARICARFSRAEEKSKRQQHDKPGRRPGKPGEERPGDDDSRERAARAEAVAQPAAGNFKQRIGEPEGTEDQADLLVAQMQIVLDIVLRLHDADAVEVCEK